MKFYLFSESNYVLTKLFNCNVFGKHNGEVKKKPTSLHLLLYFNQLKVIKIHIYNLVFQV